MRLPGRRTGLSMAEVTVCTALVGLLVVTALQTNAFVVRTSHQSNDHIHAAALCEELLSEIVPLPVNNPDGSVPSDAAYASDRSDFECVVAYDGWSASPPETKTGATLTEFASWTRGVVVTAVDPDTLLPSTNSPLHRVTVTVTRPDFSTVQASAMVVAPPRPDDPLATDVHRMHSLTLRIGGGSCDGLTTTMPTHQASFGSGNNGMGN
ncbi:MAG: hypothetical protein R3C05_19940 [Pirellulaceae bacterium]